MATVSVIIVNYNGKHLLPDCLEGLEAQTRAPDQVIVVDNGSADGSIELLTSSYSWVEVLPAGENLGFAAGNNLGIRASYGEIVVLLNNDTRPGPGFIEQVTEPIETDSSISAVAGVMVFSTNPWIVATMGIRMCANGLAIDEGTGTEWRSLPAQSEVFGPSAGAAAYRRSALEDVELFPEPYFLYLEDVDLAWRLRLRGHRTVARRDAWVQHIYSASSEEGSPMKDFYLARNRAWTLIRCWPGELWRRNWRAVLWYEIGALAYAVSTRRWMSIAGRLRGWTAMRRLWRSRKRIQHAKTDTCGSLLYWTHPAPSVSGVLSLRRMVARFSRSSNRR